MAGSEEEEGDCADLLKWAASMGITDAPRGASGRSVYGLKNSLVIANFPAAGGRGLAASRNLREGELILKVPTTALMSKLTAKEDSHLCNAIARHSHLSSVQILSVHLLNEAAKGSTSTWSPYLVHLPRVYHTLPYFMEPEIQALQVEDSKWLAKKAAEKAVMEWQGAKAIMQDIKLRRRFMSLKAWLWASATVSTRTLHVPWDEAGTLCPVGDLFNYAAPGTYVSETEDLVDYSATQKAKTEAESQGRNRGGTANEKRRESAEDNLESEIDDDISCNGVTIRERLRDGGFEPDRGEYCFYARQDYRKGQQVLLCYGLYNNLELLEHYGFLLPYNPNDHVHISLPASQEFGLENSNSFPSLGGSTCLEINGRPSFSLLAGLRLRAITPSLRKVKGHFPLMGKQVTIESDILVYQWLEKKCELLVACLPTSLEDDLILMEVLNSVQTFDALEKIGCSSIEAIAADKAQEKLLQAVHSLCTSIKECSSPYEECLNKDFQLERWKLAVEWRIGYKQILCRCINFCNNKIISLKQ